MSQDNTVNVDVKLGVNKFNVDEGHPHIILAEHPDLNEFRKLLKACPAGLYKQDESGNIHFDSAGCLECGTWSSTVRRNDPRPMGISGRNIWH